MYPGNDGKVAALPRQVCCGCALAACWKTGFFCPGGTGRWWPGMKCLEWAQQRIRPFRDGVISQRGSIMPQIKSAVCRPNHTVPLGRAFSLTPSRHFMPGYPHSVPPRRSACPLDRFSTDRAVSRHREALTRGRMSCLWVHFWSQENFQRVLPR
jgi:hypothetical protein